MNVCGMKIVLYIGRHEAERFYYQYRNDLKIEYCINYSENPYEINTFHGIPILELDILRIIKNEELLLIDRFDYQTIKVDLIKKGLQEFKHFISVDYVNKKLVIIHGNCYIEPLSKYLMSATEFKSEYYIYTIPQVYKNDKHEIQEEVLQRCDVFIHQNIHTKRFGEKLTDEWIIPRLPSSCKRIVIPNFMTINNGGVFFFPQCYGKNKRSKLIINGRCFFSQEDYYIENCYYNEKMSVSEIAGRIQEDGVFGRDIIENNFNDSMFELLEREKQWDIKISDFFLNTFHNRQFFLDAGHPADFVIREIALRVLKKLDIYIESTMLKNLGKEWLCDNETPVYQCVKDTLDLKWEDREMRKDTDNKLIYGKMDIKEYVNEYIYYLEYTKQYVKEYNLSFLHRWKKKGRLVLFGTGNWFQDYMQNYGAEVIPDLLIDNDIHKYGTEISGIKITLPEKLSIKDKVIICSSYKEVMEMQLLNAGMKNYAFYIPGTYIAMPK